jgi:antitoxin VapB
MIYINREEFPMAKARVAKLFRNGRSQAVRLPREYRFEGNEVRICRVAQGVLLQPIIHDSSRWFSELDQISSEPFMRDGRKQPAAPRRKIFR